VRSRHDVATWVLLTSGSFSVAGWSIYYDTSIKTWFYDIKFTRLPCETTMEEVLCRPWAEEVDDYKEYKRIRNEMHARRVREAGGSVDEQQMRLRRVG
jgi:hypothetical protein